MTAPKPETPKRPLLDAEQCSFVHDALVCEKHRLKDKMKHYESLRPIDWEESLGEAKDCLMDIDVAIYEVGLDGSILAAELARIPEFEAEIAIHHETIRKLRSDNALLRTELER